MQYNIAIVGPTHVTAGFGALGVVPFAAATGEEAQTVLEQLVASSRNDDANNKKKFAVIIVIESLLRQIAPKDYARLTRGTLPAIITISGTEGASDYMSNRLRDLTIRAIGADII